GVVQRDLPIVSLAEDRPGGARDAPRLAGGELGLARLLAGWRFQELPRNSLGAWRRLGLRVPRERQGDREDHLDHKHVHENTACNLPPSDSEATSDSPPRRAPRTAPKQRPWNRTLPTGPPAARGALAGMRPNSLPSPLRLLSLECATRLRGAPAGGGWTSAVQCGPSRSSSIPRAPPSSRPCRRTCSSSSSANSAACPRRR